MTWADRPVVRKARRPPGPSLKPLVVSGNGGNKVVMVKDLDAVVVVTRTNYDQPDMHGQSQRLVKQHLLAKLPCLR